MQVITPMIHKHPSDRNTMLMIIPAIASPFPSSFPVRLIPLSAIQEKISPSSGIVSDNTNPAIAIPL
ncbi:MAG: hypothetical protein JWN40_4436 [Phycisphaerales bacterium]|nr:hypothetical protein [Phycisphaerales bacterium]